MAFGDKCKNCKKDCNGEVYRYRGKVKHRIRHGRIVGHSTCSCGCDNPEFKEVQKG